MHRFRLLLVWFSGLCAAFCIPTSHFCLSVSLLNSTCCWEVASVKNVWHAICKWPVKQHWHTNNYFSAVPQMLSIGLLCLNVLFLTYYTWLNQVSLCWDFFSPYIWAWEVSSARFLSHLSFPTTLHCIRVELHSLLCCRACGESRHSPRPRTPLDKVTEVCHSEIKTAPSIQRVPPPGSHYHSRSPCQKAQMDM